MLEQETILVSKGVIRGALPALDDIVLADLECRRDHPAIALVAGQVVIPAELSPADIVVTASRIRRGYS